MRGATTALHIQAPPHVGAILLALREVLALLFEAEIPYGEPCFRPAALPVTHELAVAIGFAGDVSGWLTLGMTRATAVALARTLTDDHAEAYAVMSEEGLVDVANVMAGACAVSLHRRGFKLSLRHPVVAIDEPLTVAWPSPCVLEVTLAPAGGPIAVAIGMRVRGAEPPQTALRIAPISLDFEGFGAFSPSES